MKLSILILLFISFNAFASFGFYNQTENIPLENIRIPSNDLVDWNMQKLTAEQAWKLSQKGYHLAAFNPEESAVWSNQFPHDIDSYDNVDMENMDSVTYEGSITSASTFFRFNVTPDNNPNGSYFTILMQKRLHTTLLRKNLLRKIGYNVPAIKYLKNLVVRFKNLDDKKAFLKEMAYATEGAPSRWVTKGEKSDDLELTVQDIAVMEPKQSDHYNLAMGVPAETLLSRTLRSLITVYDIANVPESINKLTWQTGKIQDEYLNLEHFTLADMNPTLDDVKWSLRRISKLTRSDFTDIVEQAYYPKSVAKVLVEKLISRRNSLNKLLDERAEAIAINENISYKNEVEDGYITRQGWDGYAANFTHGAPDSPMQELKYYVLSELQTEVISNAVSFINKQLRGFDPQDKRIDFLKKDFEKGLEHYLSTGEMLKREVQSWVSPIVNGGINVSRDIVIGNEFGSDNLVQMSDTFGINVKLGAHIGLENLPIDLGGFATTDATVSKSYTHLKPVKTLKQSLKEPYRNMIVPYFQSKLKKSLNKIANLESDDQNEIDTLMDFVNKYLGVGETFISTQSIRFSGAGAATYVDGINSFRLSASGGQLLIKRVQVYRKSADEVQVFVDNGNSRSLGISFTYSAYIPVIRLTTNNTSGKYETNIYSININPSLEKNADLKMNSKALAYLIEEDSTELLDELQSPFSLRNKFSDDSFKFALFNWRSKHLDKSSEMNLITPDKQEVELIKITDEKMSGFNNRAFVTDIANYYLSKSYGDLNFSTNIWGNPANTFKGTSKKRVTRFEARKKGNSYSDEFISIQRNFQGWEIDSDDLEELIREDIEEKYNQQLFDHYSIKEASGLMLYNVIVNVNIYEAGLKKLMKTSTKDLYNFQKANGYVKRTQQCRDTFNSSSFQCGKLSRAISKKRSCEKSFKKKKFTKAYACLVDVVTMLEDKLKFEDFKTIFGKDNFYVYGSINGFRKKSEILNEPIQSNTIGKVGSKFWNGPVEWIREMAGTTSHAFDGGWLREIL